MASKLPSLEQVQELLRQLQNPATVKAASDYLRKYFKHPASMPVLFQLMRVSPHPTVRQMAGVYLRKKLLSHWKKLDAEARHAIKIGALETLVQEQDRGVRNSVAQLISLVARITLPTNEWNDCLPSLYQIVGSPNPDHRESALMIIEEIVEHCGDTANVKHQFPGVIEYLRKCLALNEHPKVRVSALKVVGAMTNWYTDQDDPNAIAKFREFVPIMLENIKNFIETKSNEEAVTSLGVFDDIVESNLPAFTDTLPLIMNFVLEVGKRPEIDLNVRIEALTFIQWVAQFKPKTITQNNLVEPILAVIFPMGAEPESQEEESSDSEYDISAHKYSAQVIDSMCKYLKSSKVVEPVMKHVHEYIQLPNPHARKASISALTVLVRNCADALQEKLGALLPYLYKGFADDDVRVRKVACLCLSQFSENFSDITEYHEQVIPLLLRAMNENDAEVQERACYSLVAYLENLDERVLKYSDMLMTRLIDLLRKGNKDIQEMAISGISAVASCAKQSFMTYYTPVMEMMKQLMTITHHDQLLLRSRATECAGIVALAVGKENFRPLLPFFMDLAVRGLALQNGEEMREYTYSFFANVAEAYKEEFKDFLPVVVPLLLAGIESTDGVEEAPAEAQEDDGLDFEGEEEEDELDPLNYQAPTSFIDEKNQALSALAVISVATKGFFLPFLERCLATLTVTATHVHPDLRRNCINPLENFISVVHSTHPPARPAMPGLPPNEQPLPDNTRQFIDACFQIILPMFEDDDKNNVARVCESISHVVATCGSPGIDVYMTKIAPALMNILSGTASCQNIDDEDYDDVESVKAEDLLLFEACCDCVVNLAKAYGPLFVNFFPLLQNISTYLKDEIEATYRQEAMGSLADIANSIAMGLMSKLDEFAQWSLAGLKDKHGPTRSNSAFLFGILCHYCGEATVKYFPVALEGLTAMFNETDNVVRDNACGAIGRMIISAPAAVPLAQLLPVYFAALPIREDFEEAKPAYGAIIKLVQLSNEAITPFIPQIVNIFSLSVNNESITQELRVQMVELLKNLFRNFGPQLQEVVKALSPQQQEVLSKILA